MPEIGLKHIVSCNSEDPKFPAENLVKSGTYKKWKCLAGEKEAVVLIQLGKSTSILSIDIGNEYSAFIEVLVARATANDDQFQVLLPASSFMNPSESRLGSNPNRVRLFKAEQINSAVARQKWDRIKVVCTQPFNKNASYGISFIRLHEEGEAPKPAAVIAETQVFDEHDSLPDTQPLDTHIDHVKPTQPLQIGSFTLKPEDDDEDMDTGALFSKRKLISPSTTTTNNNTNRNRASISNTSTPTGPSAKKSKIDDWKKTKQHSTANSPSASSSAKDAPPSASNKQNTPKTSKIVVAPNPPPPKQEAKKKLKRVPFEKLLDGVTIVLSGYVNPQRASLRQKACDMGAKYAPEWKSGCTHLVCAVINTPKFNQVKGKGNIVKHKWIDDCTTYKKRFAWRKYALDPADQTAVYSDEEVEVGDAEDQPSTSTAQKPTANGSHKKVETVEVDDDDGDATNGVDDDDDVYEVSTDTESSEEDTDDEIQRATGNKDKKQKKKVKISPRKAKQSAETKVDKTDGCKLQVDANGLPILPDFFNGNVFFLYGEFVPSERKQITRFVTAFGGKLEQYMGDSITHVITRDSWSETFDKAVADNENLVFVKPEWILQCGKSSKLVSLEEYLLKKE